jgi:hypothetical protein
MDADDPRDDIASLEERIEDLSESLERCRKLAVAARVAIAAGAVLLALIVIGAIRFAPLNLLGAIAAVMGGIVLYGSNSSTWKETAAAIAAAEARRSELIDQLEMREAGGLR